MSHNSNNNTSNDKVVKVIGIGGSGIYTTSYMAKNPIQNVKYGIICNYEDYKMFNNSNYPYIEYYKSAIRLLDIYLLLDPMVNGKLRSRADLYRFYTHKPENIEIINSIFCGNPKYLIIVAGLGRSGMLYIRIPLYNGTE